MDGANVELESTIARDEPAVVSGGNRVAFAAFYNIAGVGVQRALTVTLGDADLAVEATQEAMARAWRDWPTVGRARNPAGWVYRVGLNWARSRLRRRKWEVLRPTEERPHQDAHVDPTLTAALARLSPKHRSVLVLRYYLDWPVEEVADALGLPVGTVKSRQHWALRRLREVLDDTRP